MSSDKKSSPVQPLEEEEKIESTLEPSKEILRFIPF